MKTSLKTRYIFISFALLLVLAVLVVTLIRPKKGPYESICIPSGIGGTRVLNYAILYDGKLFPLRGDLRQGCLLLHDYYTWDDDGDGILEPYRWAQFVEPSYDHCCTGGG